MSKEQRSFKIKGNTVVSGRYHVIDLEGCNDFHEIEIKPGQFVQVLAPDRSGAFLRRPISIHDVNLDTNTLTLLVCRVGAGTESICNAAIGTHLDIVWPLGNGFTLPENKDAKVLLMGGGVGVAPLLYLGKKLIELGHIPNYILAARNSEALLRLHEFEKSGKVFIATDDGSAGQKGLITEHSAFNDNYDMVYCCGPVPMMKAVAKICRERNLNCEVSLENTMACGIGACLCCVEKTVRGNRCVCTDGPVFNINELTW